MTKQKFIHLDNKVTFSLLLSFILIATSFAVKAQGRNDVANTQVYHIQNYFSEVYLVKSNDKLVLIETGVPVPGYQDSLVKSIQKLGFKPENIVLAVITHGHGDHAGNARFFQEKFHIPLAGSKYDLGKFTNGKTELSKSESVSIWGDRLRSFSDMNYPPFTPDVIVENTKINLSKYGINGRIIPVKGGHTPGDLLVLIGEHLFVGDAFVGTFKLQGQSLVPDGHHVREHFYHENRALADKELKTIEKIAIDNKVKIIYPTHNGPVSTNELTKYIREEPTLKTLTKIQSDLLNEVGQGKSELLNKYLSDNYIFNNSEGKQFSKNEFIENYISNPTTKIEAIVAEDFRIIYADNNTAIMSFIENIKPAGKDAKNVLATATFVKNIGDWKLIFEQNINQ